MSAKQLLRIALVLLGAIALWGALAVAKKSRQERPARLALPVLDTARTQGILPSFLSPDRKIPMIAARDIGHIAAECLLDQPKGRRVLELSGPADYSARDVAAAVGRRLKHEVAVKPLPTTAVVPTFTAMGFSENAAQLFAEMYDGLESGRITYEGNGACRPRGLVTLAEAVSEWLDRS